MKILLLTSVLPWPLRRNGGAQRTELLKRALARHGSVDVIGVGGAELFEQGRNEESEAIAFKSSGVIGCVEISTPAFRPLPRLISRANSLVKTLRSNRSRYQVALKAEEKLHAILKSGDPYDLIVSRYLSPAFKVGLDKIVGIPKILDFDDVDWITFESSIQANPWRGMGGMVGQALVLRDIKRACHKGLGHFDGVWVTCAEDANQVKSASVLPNIPFFPIEIAKVDVRSEPRAGQRILFVGDLQFPPNLHGLDRFILHIWPKIIEKIPAAMLQIVGRGLDQNKANQWKSHDGVVVTGFVEDLTACYRQCAFTIVPVYFGGGTKIKVLESLSYGRTLVATPVALRGYSSLISEPKALMIAESDYDFAKACIALLTDPATRESMAKIGLEVVNQKFSFEEFSAAVSCTVEQVVFNRR